MRSEARLIADYRISKILDSLFFLRVEFLLKTDSGYPNLLLRVSDFQQYFTPQGFLSSRGVQTPLVGLGGG